MHQGMESIDALLDTNFIDTHNSKSICYGVWYPTIAQMHITLVCGMCFSSLSHSVPHRVFKDSGQSRTHKGLELLPEESLYLIERLGGVLSCLKENHESTTYHSTYTQHF